MKTALLAEKNVGKITKCLSCESLTVLKEIHSKFFSQRAPLHFNFFFLTGLYIVRQSNGVFVGSLFLPTFICWLVGQVVSKITQKLLNQFWLNFHQKVSFTSFQLIIFWWPKFTQKSKSLVLLGRSNCCHLLLLKFRLSNSKITCLSGQKTIFLAISLDWIDIKSQVDSKITNNYSNTHTYPLTIPLPDGQGSRTALAL